MTSKSPVVASVMLNPLPLAGVNVIAPLDVVNVGQARLVADATPRIGVTNVGDVAKTRLPDPVSSLMTPASSADVVAAKTLNLFAVSAIVPLASGRSIVLLAVSVS